MLFRSHQPDREDGGIPNPHFHVLCPIRPIEQNGKWGLKQRRVYELDEDGNRIRDADGKFVFHQLCHFGACEIFDLRGKALNRAAQIAKAVGSLGAADERLQGTGR